MRIFRIISLTAMAGAFCAATAVTMAAQQMPPMPKPGPEHEIFKMDAGTWDAVVEFVMAPGTPAVLSKGIETNTIGCGGLCLISEFKGEAMGQPFHGVGITVWDAAQRKYVGSWTDSMSGGLASMEGTWDAATKTLNGWMEAPDSSGQRIKMRTVAESRGDTRVMTSFVPGPGGQEMQVMRITSTRRK